MSITIRPYQEDDRDSLAHTIDGVCAEGMMATRKFEPTPAWCHALETPACSRHLLLVAAREDQAIGWCRLFPRQCETEGSDAELGIGVAQEWRRQGIGTDLVNDALVWAEKRGFARVRLRTREDNEPAIYFFNKTGFQTHDKKNGNLEMIYLFSRSRMA